MTTEQDIRTVLVDEASGAPPRQGSLGAVLTRGRRRRRTVRAAFLVGGALTVAALITVPATLLSDGPVDLAEVDDRGQIEIAGETFPVGEALETLGSSPIYASVPGPEPRFDTQRLGAEYPFQIGTPDLGDTDQIDGPAVYIGYLRLAIARPTENKTVVLIEERSGGFAGSQCLMFASPSGESPIYTCAESSRDNRSMPVWIGVPEGTAVVSFEVDGVPVAWQRPRSRVAVIPHTPTQAPSSVRVVAQHETAYEIAVLPITNPVTDDWELLHTFETKGFTYGFWAFPNQQIPDASCVGLTRNVGTAMWSTMGCPTEKAEEIEYAARISLEGKEFLVGYGLRESETIQIPDAIHTFVSDQIDGRRFFIVQIPQAPDTDPYTIEILNADGTTRTLDAHVPNE